MVLAITVEDWQFKYGDIVAFGVMRTRAGGWLRHSISRGMCFVRAGFLFIF
jgi:hypothetical protein